MTKGGKWLGKKIRRILCGVYVAEGDMSLLLFVVRVMIFYCYVLCLLFGHSSRYELQGALIVECDTNDPGYPFRVSNL